MKRLEFNIENMENARPYERLKEEYELLQQQLEEAKDTIEAIKNGEIDALVVQGKNGHELFTLQSADVTYRIFIEKMSEGAATLNAEGVIVYCNPSFAFMVGEPTENVVSELFETFVIPYDLEKYRSLIAQGLQCDVKGEISLSQKDDGIIPVLLSITSLRNSDEHSLNIIVTDLTAIKENTRQLKAKNDELELMNVALELSNHDLQQFASVASHDLQEPLRKIQIFTHLFKDKFYDQLADLPKQYLEKITSAADRMKVLIVDILNYSRLSAKDNQFVKTDLNAIISELLDDMEFTIKEKKAKIVVSDLPDLEINRGQIRQVFQNLISNAIKFAKTNTNPVIEVYSKDSNEENMLKDVSKDFCYIHIKDNGIGFEEKYAKSIFNLFEKLHSKDVYEGTGIGLAIAKKIVEKHHGNINVVSEVGVGTEFIISLPLNQNNFITH
jgi:PAS domain S-box-containing protein